jgi:hypothetical protein
MGKKRGTMTNKKVNPRLPKVLESCDHGVLEWWSIGVLYKDIHLLTITPLLQHSEII